MSKEERHTTKPHDHPSFKKAYKPRPIIIPLPTKTLLNPHIHDMPLQRTSPRSSSHSLSPYSPSPSLNRQNQGPPIDVHQFAELVDNPDKYERVQAELFGRYDLVVKTIMFRHVYETIGQLRKEVRRQWTVAEDLFDEMARTGLHHELGDIGRGPVIPFEPEQIEILEQEDLDPVPPYQQTLSPDVPLIRSIPQRTTPPIDVCFPSIPVTSLEEVCEGMARYEISTPAGSRQNPILIIDEEDESDNTEDEFTTPSSDIFCYHCHHCGHVYYDCADYQCDNCHDYAPGHSISNCFYAHYH